MKTKMAALYLATVAALLLAENVLASGNDIADQSKREYMNYCAVCHGKDGKGGGNMAELLKVAPADLTLLSKKNGGVFPYNRIYAIIDGRTMVKGHGDRDMPIWGQAFIDKMGEASEYYTEGDKEMEMYARARILRLVDYIFRIQSIK